MNFQEHNLGDLAELVAMGPFGSDMKKSFFVDEGIPIISGAHLHRTKLNDQKGFDFLTEEKANKHKRSLVTRGDVLFTAYGTIGQVSFIPHDSIYQTYIVSQRQFFLRPKKDLLDYKYLTYFFKSGYGQHILLANASQVGVPSIARPTSYLKSLKIKLPSLPDQKKISGILSILDQKIELNQKMNETLEDIAKTLFKSWFIDFDPVRAKAEGRPTGLSKEISDLFPDSFEKSELGEIPMGWSKSVITDIAYKISDKYKKDEDWSNEKLIDLSRMPSNSISLNSYGRGDELSTSVCKFKKYDFLFGSIRPYFYKAGICPYDGVSNTSVFILRAKKTYDREFIYCYSSSEVTFEKSVQYSDGTKMPIIKWKDFKEFQFAIPNEDIRKHFSTIINPIVEKIICNIEEQEILSKLRDTLLPKLISGELKIPDAENLIKEAGN